MAHNRMRAAPLNQALVALSSLAPIIWRKGNPCMTMMNL